MAIAQIQIRRGTTAEWAAASPVVLAAGEFGYDITLKRTKIGDGTTEWASLEWDELRKWPIGSIYMSVSSTSPATLFGGTWAALGGRMLIGVDETYTAGSTGGAATHTLTVAQMPNHSHYLSMRHNGTLGGDGVNDGSARMYGGTLNNDFFTSSYAGGNMPHNNLPPYLAVYMWKRTA
jgi:hypothetical protein